MSIKGIVRRMSDSHTYCYTWTTEFCLCCYSRVDSPKFDLPIDGYEHTWHLQIFNKISTNPSENCTSVYLILDTYSKYNTDMDVRATFSIVNDKGQLTNTQTIEKHSFTASSNEISVWRFIDHKSLREYPERSPCKLIPGGSLTLVCEIASRKFDNNDKLQEIFPRMRISNQDFSVLDDLELTFNNQKFSDLTLIVEEQEIRVHKAILASRSPVFAAMLESNMAEKEKNKVDITDIDYETMKHVLMYIYTGKVENLELASMLLRPADKYALDGLKNICTEVLSDAMTVENVVETLKLADLYRASKLKEKAIDFMAKHFKDVTATEGFKSVLKSDSQLFEKS